MRRSLQMPFFTKPQAGQGTSNLLWLYQIGVGKRDGSLETGRLACFYFAENGAIMRKMEQPFNYAF
jgi:hypothetical protein